ncbi:DEAD/DEAH box helicase [Actinomadura sp. GC306]|uniref:protein DpdJ n=1 Tax=Actinomadura sp. GC306 TaxID=2530367 RepID=UPI00104B5989|nr:protein DpdJ [Actinomadura sp. GC306]TDC70593.1 DEAD/DEAH box helicase [Actinomadura sp. GC306]
MEWRFASHLLDRLEDLEFPVLSWGATNGALSEEEVLDTVEESLARHPDAPTATARQVVDWLLGLRLLHQVPFTSPPRYRTRFAEGMRLTSELRQLFPFQQGKNPQYPDPGWWQRGARLVADYRLHVAKRRYPKRNISPAAALMEFSALNGWGPIQEKVATALMSGWNLSRFQVEATKNIYSAFSIKRSSGVIVGAGTGSGKTLAFYLPTLTDIGATAHSTASYVHTLALYPRKELLRDQLREAVANVERIEQTPRRQQRRPLRIGVLYSDVIRSADALNGNSSAARAWKRRPDGFVCPYLTCPSCTMGLLIWPAERHAVKVEHLLCVECGNEISGEQLALTRNSLTARPPDLLFTTTEMLNRSSTDPKLGKLLGWSGGRTPRVVLLDEVHTYTGVHGAQVALVLRRWRNALRKPVTFVGLSATLREAHRFFAQLTGLAEADVTYIEPDFADMEEEGREYALALRGDPLSGASLLSTSIQAAMLFGRLLDPRGKEGLYGSTGFLFTDDLDVTNRYYRNLRSAEGQGTGPRYRRKVLAGLRSPAADHRAERYQDGQSWDFVERIGHLLDPGLTLGGLKIGRTSSQDAGVSLEARLIVATASLEVGFNDPRVGLVMQHKTPHDASSFIQRRGRAGRQRRTRPLTVVALSDYGRDRLTYQAYETLFAPQVTASSLPIRNRYVLKVQAAQVLLDWLQQRLRPLLGKDLNVRKLLTAPASPLEKPAHVTVAQELNGLLCEDPENSPRQDSLARYLQDSLKISADEAQALMWEQPRSLMLAVIPTALRRLETHWGPVRPDPGAAPYSLLPEFVTKSLFAPLNLPEVEFQLPFDVGKPEEERMPVAQALREAVPGRVSMRFGYGDDRHRTWLPVPLDSSTELELDSNVLVGFRVEGEWRGYNGPREMLTVLRPHRIKLKEPDKEIEDRSQGTPLWATDIVESTNAPGNNLEAAASSSWLKDVHIGFRTHAGGNPVTIRRMTFGADATVARGGGNELRSRVRYTYQGAPAALGFELLVDAIQIRLPQIDLTLSQVQEYLCSPQWRSQAFYRAVDEDPVLVEFANVFKRGWLSLIYFTAFSLKGLETSRTPEEIWTSMADGSWRDEIERILQVLYRSEETTTDALAETRLVKALRELSQEQAVVDALNRAGNLLFAEDVAAQTQQFARRFYHDTLAAAALEAALRLCPDAQETDLIVDVVPGKDPDDPATIWLSETSVGGLGVVERLVHTYHATPQRFWSTLVAALKPNEYEYTDAAVTRLLRNIVDEEPDGTAAVAVQAIRDATSIAETEIALREIRAVWTELDGPPRHSAVAALLTRVLRPGSGPGSDEETLRLLDAWTETEDRLGFEVDARVIAYAVGTGAIRTGERQLRADQAFSMLWPRGAQARSCHLQYYQPFIPLEQPVFLDRLLADAALEERLPRIDITQPGWAEPYEQGMVEAGAVDLVCPVEEREALATALTLVPLIAVDRDVLRLHGEIDGMSRAGGRILVRVVLREVEQ